MAEIFESIPFNFDEIYDGIVDKFQDKGYDAPYEGSNLAQLITAMAYATSMLNANTAANINETILTLANKRKNILEDARLLGYEPEHKLSYRYNITVQALENGNIIIPKYSAFTAGDKTYYYFGTDIEILGALAGDTVDIEVKEGTLTRFVDRPDLLSYIIEDTQYIDFSFPDTETDGIELYVTYYNTDGALIEKELWTKSDTLILDKNTNTTKQFIRLDNIDLELPRVYFVISGVGNEIPTGATVDVNILQSSGAEGEMLELPKTDVSNIEATAYTLLVKGAEEESNESIKSNAPLLHNTASRAVTADDYQVVCNKHAAVSSTIAWGGEDEYPITLGNIYFSWLNEKNVRAFTNNADNTSYILSDKEDLVNNYLTETDIRSVTYDENGNLTNLGVLDLVDNVKLPALKLNIRNPIHVFADYNLSVVKYNLGVSKISTRGNLFDILDTYFQTLEKFESQYFNSNTVKRFDEFLTDITGLELDVDFNIMLDSKSIDTINSDINEPNDHGDIFIYLAPPFEGVFDTAGAVQEINLPKIDTADFKVGEDLVVDFASYTTPVDETDNAQKTIIYDINLDGVKVGEYMIFNDRELYIRVKLFCKLTGAVGLSSEYSTSTLEFSDFDTPKYLNFDYKTNNFKVIRNTILKLNTVTIN